MTVDLLSYTRCQSELRKLTDVLLRIFYVLKVDPTMSLRLDKRSTPAPTKPPYTCVPVGKNVAQLGFQSTPVPLDMKS